jgi:serine/threonine-protein kinase
VLGGEVSLHVEEPPVLDGYEVLDEIAAGGMGVVWRVRDEALRRDLAIKVMKTELAPHADYVKRFLAEAEICGQLTHPFIVPVHAIGRLDDGRPYYTMKLVEGQTLATRLSAAVDRRDCLIEWLQLFNRVCQAVAFAHRKGVIHRDLKPSNIMVGRHEEIQLMDWGLAKVLNSGSHMDTSETADSRVAISGEAAARNTTVGAVGTFAYMPPEQAYGMVGQVDKRSDVFALGAILCEILTGKPPYFGSPQETKTKARLVDLRDARLRLESSGAHPEIIELAKRCLARERSDRPVDGGRVAAAIDDFSTGVQQRLEEERLARERERVEATEDRKRLTLQARWEKKRRQLTMGLAGAVLAALVVAAIGISNYFVEQARRDQQVTEIANWAERQMDLGNWQRAKREWSLLADILLDSDATSQVFAERQLDLLQLRHGLEKVRHYSTTWVNGQFECDKALDGYAAAFTANGDLAPGVENIDEERTEQVIARIKQLRPSMANEIVATFDDWAWLAERERRKSNEPAKQDTYRKLRNRLLEIASRSDRDPSKRKKVIRDPRCWDNTELLVPVVEQRNLTAESPQMLVLIGKLLLTEDHSDRWRVTEKLWRDAIAHHPDDFWLHLEMGTLLMRMAQEQLAGSEEHPASNLFLGIEAIPEEARRLARDAARFYQTALGFRSDELLSGEEGAVGICLDLAAAIRLSGNEAEAMTYLRRAAECAPDSLEVNYEFGLALRVQGDVEGALEYFKKAENRATPDTFPSLSTVVEKKGETVPPAH